MRKLGHTWSEGPNFPEPFLGPVPTQAALGGYRWGSDLPQATWRVSWRQGPE